MFNTMDIRTLCVIGFKFRWRAFAVFAFCVALAIVASLLIRTQYTATASILVKIGRELVYRPDIGEASSAMPSIDRDELYASNIQIMRTPSLIEAVIDHVGLSRIYPDLAEDKPSGGPSGDVLAAIRSAIGSAFDAVGLGSHLPPPSRMAVAVSRVEKHLWTDVAKRTGIIQVTFMNPDPVVAADVANAVVAEFQKRAGAIYDSPDLQFEQARVDTQRAELDEAQNKLNAYRHAHNVYALNDQLGLLLQQKVTIDSKLKDTDSQITQLQGLVAALTAQVAETPKTVALFTDTQRHRAVDDATQQLMQLQLQERQMATRFGNDYPQLVALRNEINAARAALAEQAGQVGSQSRTALNEIRTSLDQSRLQNQAQLKSLLAMRDTLRDQIGTIETAIATLSNTQPELTRLEQDVNMRTGALKASYDKLVEMRTVEGLNHQKPASFSVYQPAIPPELASPARPASFLYMVIAVGVGLLGALVTVFLSYRMFNGFLTPKQVALRLNRPVLAVVDYDRRLKGWGPARAITYGPSTSASRALPS
jgi:uncharacterized protein involved in exopolysaccharide biosynthesis